MIFYFYFHSVKYRTFRKYWRHFFHFYYYRISVICCICPHCYDIFLRIMLIVRNVRKQKKGIRSLLLLKLLDSRYKYTVVRIWCKCEMKNQKDDISINIIKMYQQHKHYAYDTTRSIFVKYSIKISHV